VSLLRGRRAAGHRHSSSLTPPGAGLLVLGLVVAALSRASGNGWLVLVTGASIALLLASRPRSCQLGGRRLSLTGPPRARAGAPFSRTVTVALGTGCAAVPSSALVVASPLVEVPRLLVPPLGAGQEVAATTTWRALRRGRLELLDLTEATTGHFGLWRVEHRLRLGCPLVVHPALAEPAVLVTSRYDSADPARATAPGGPDLAGLRAWRSGDERRDVHWRASARRGRLVVAERDAPLDRAWLLAVVGPPTSPADEAALATAAATACLALGRGPVHVVAAGPDGVRAAPTGSPTELLDWFADLAEVGAPSSATLLAALPAGADVVNVVVCTAASTWWASAGTDPSVRWNRLQGDLS
jgi:uncharacterized protein (DUF58 family)